MATGTGNHAGRQRTDDAREAECDGDPGDAHGRSSCGAAEGHDERRQVDPQRNDPQERNRGHVGRDVRGDAEHQGGRQECQTGPPKDLCPVRTGPGCGVGRRRRDHRLRRRSSYGERAGGGERDEDEEARGPPLALRCEIELRLDDERVGQQSTEAAEVAGGEQEVRVIGAMAASPRVPPLQQGAGRRQDDEGQPDHYRQRAQQPQDRRAVCGGGRVAGYGHREGEQGEQEHHEVRAGLPAPPEAPRAEVCVVVGQQQEHLEEQRAGAPHRRRAAVRGQQQLGDQGLHDEQQAGAQERRRCEQDGLDERGALLDVRLGRRRLDQ